MHRSPLLLEPLDITTSPICEGTVPLLTISQKRCGTVSRTHQTAALALCLPCFLGRARAQTLREKSDTTSNTTSQMPKYSKRTARQSQIESSPEHSSRSLEAALCGRPRSFCEPSKRKAKMLTAALLTCETSPEDLFLVTLFHVPFRSSSAHHGFTHRTLRAILIMDGKPQRSCRVE